jgi:hypothetical protein
MSFADHLADLYARPSRSGLRSVDNLADAILADPQAHIDALVEAGVLRASNTDRPEAAYYEVVAPHVHEWRVSFDAPPVPDMIDIRCGCGRIRSIPNRLPIKAPDE